jgi:hypothetical protein
LSKFDFAAIKVPLLFVHHVSDQCESTPYGDAARLSEKYSLISVFGGATPQSGPCDPFSFWGQGIGNGRADRELDSETGVQPRSEIECVQSDC